MLNPSPFTPHASRFTSRKAVIRIIRDVGKAWFSDTLRAGFAIAHTAPFRKSAFTLAEVLITLGIIGVVAAMTLPTLVNNKQNKELQTQFKKVYSELNQMSRLFYKDYGMSVSEYLGGTSNGSATYQKFLNEIFPHYFKGGKVLSDWTYSDVDEETGSANPNALYPIYNMVGKSITFICDNGGFQSDVGGRIYLFNDVPVSGNNGPIVCVDINGQKKPNRWGYDYFMFVFTTDGFVIPMGQPHPNNVPAGQSAVNHFVTGEEYCKRSNGSYSQEACAYYALADKHPSEEGKNYWQDFLGSK